VLISCQTGALQAVMLSLVVHAVYDPAAAPNAATLSAAADAQLQ
jgi:hypothetical protein